MLIRTKKNQTAHLSRILPGGGGLLGLTDVVTGWMEISSGHGPGPTVALGIGGKSVDHVGQGSIVQPGGGEGKLKGGRGDVQLSGGPESSCGQGGRISVLDVVLLSAPVTATVTGGSSKLGNRVIRTPGVWSLLTW